MVKLELELDSKSPSVGLYTASHLAGKEVTLKWTDKETKASWSTNSTSSTRTILRILGSIAKDLYTSDPAQKTLVDMWMDFAEEDLASEDVGEALHHLEEMLADRSYLVADSLTVADLAVFDRLLGLRNSIGSLKNISRYFNFMEQVVRDKIPKKDVEKLLTTSAGQPRKVVSLDSAGSKDNKSSNKQGGDGSGNKRNTGGGGAKKGGGGGDNKETGPGGDKGGKKKDEGKFVELPGAEVGNVVVRFPPEASGYLHIGHAKAALLNQYYQKMFQGKFILRFDDTNPAKEKEHFEEVILEDVEMLGIKPDIFTYSSDSFDLMLELCEKLIKEGKAYVDDTDGDTMREERSSKIESKNRANSVQKNLTMWEEMKKGTKKGQECCVRAKIDMNSANGCMRDPTIYRCKPEPHPRTGDKYKVYPTYDFTCPIVDSIEGVTHALRTTEYHDRDDQYYWFIDALGLRKPYIYEYSRLNLTNTVLSKRKLTWFVEQGIVDGWDDPRFPTVRGVLRRGMTVEGLKQFIVAQGSSKSVVTMSWDKIWAFNRQVIDPVAPRFTALMKESLIPVYITNAEEEKVIQVQAHPKNPEIGMRNVPVSKVLWVEEDDAKLFKTGENVTFVNLGNVMITKIIKTGDGEVDSEGGIEATLNLDDKNYKNTLKVTWLPDSENIRNTPVLAVFYDHIISKPVLNPDEDFKNFIGENTKVTVSMVGDSDLKNVKKGDIIQLQRKGFFICDIPYKPRSIYSCVEVPVILFAIPDGKTKENPTVKIPGKTQVQKVGESQAPASRSLEEIDANIRETGDAIRDLKAKKSAKEVIDQQVQKLLALKVEFKTVAGKDWDPKGNNVPQSAVASATAPGPNSSTGGSSLQAIDSAITAQGNRIRDLKSQKAGKDVLEKEVKQLLTLKAEFKTAAGKDWDPKGNNVPQSASAPTPAVNSSAGSSPLEAIDSAITAQGNKIRDLKSQKAGKEAVEKEVKQLLTLKAEFKAAAGKDWDPKGNNIPKSAAPVQVSAVPQTANSSVTTIDAAITAQGNRIRDLKSQKASKEVIEKEVKQLLVLKTEFKAAAGKDWDPKGNNVPQSSPAPAAVTNSPASSSSSLEAIDSAIIAQGNKIRDLKSQKAGKDAVEKEVKQLLSLKAEFKAAAGKDWDPKGNNVPKSNTPPSATSVPTPAPSKMSSGAEIKTKIEEQGNKVRSLKESKAAKGDIDAAVKTLLELKVQYKAATGEDYAPPGGNQRSGGGGKKDAKKENKPPAAAAPPKDSGDASGKKQTKLGIDCKKLENLSDWFSQVITKGEMIEYYDVSGCYIFRPWSYAIWEAIKEWFDTEIKKLGVQNCYFPMFVSQSALQKEKDHIADFAPEVAWVTRSGDTELAEPIAIRPTSETVMYPSFAKWVQSHRDLPIKLNQWNNVVRWEFKHPQPFLRTREFLWQEGHTAFATYKEAEEEVYQILDLYEKVYTHLLAIPVVPGRKTEKEKFPGGDFTTTVEAFISASGRGLQGATSHHLGQNFSKMFGIEFEDPDPSVKEKAKAYQNSWGLSTRTIGAMVMVHGDDQGLVIPPRVAAVQVVIIPCGITASLSDKDKNALLDECKTYEQRLIKSGVRAKGDFRDNYSPGWKFNHWELKGVPIRIEIGPRDLKDSQYVAVKRFSGEKTTQKKATLEADVTVMLNGIHEAMFNKAKSELESHLIVTESWTQFCIDLDKKNIIMAPFCGRIECEDTIKKESARDEPSEPGAPAMGAKSLCIPFKQPKELKAGAPCVHPKCSTPAQKYTLFGRSY